LSQRLVATAKIQAERYLIREITRLTEVGLPEYEKLLVVLLLLLNEKSEMRTMYTVRVWPVNTEIRPNRDGGLTLGGSQLTALTDARNESFGLVHKLARVRLQLS
jgi:hypothetical protein